jgi:S1-C subfamily serine protease
VNRRRLISLIAAAAGTCGLLLAASTLIGGAPAQASNARSATVRKVFPSAVRLQIASAGDVVRSASGVAFAQQEGRTYLLTNAHVVDRASSWKEPVELRVLVSGRAQPLVGRVVAAGKVPDLDIAVIEVASTELQVTPLADEEELELGDDLVVIGAPFGKGLSVAAGIVSQVDYEFSENAAGPRIAKALKTDAAIGYGSSGGGVFDVPRGRLVGLVEGYRTARVAFGKDEGYAFDVPMPGETFVAPAAKIRKFLLDRGLVALAGGREAAESAAKVPTALSTAVHSRM